MASELAQVQEQLQRARADLRHVEEGIKKTSVRDPNYGFGDRFGVRRGARRGGMAGAQRFQREDIETPPKRQISSVASRLGPPIAREKEEEEDEEEEEDDDAPILKSSVIQSGNLEQSREAAVVSDKATVQRSRRLFGSLLMGTLKQFKQDKEKTKEQEDKQAEVMDKILKKEIQRKQQTAADRQKLYQCKDDVKDEIKLLERQMAIAQMKIRCEEERDKLLGFIQTKCKPHLYYLPKSHSIKTTKSLKESNNRVRENYKAKLDNFDKQIKDTKDRISEVQKVKEAVESLSTITITALNMGPKVQTVETEEKPQNKETGIKIEVQLRTATNGNNDVVNNHDSEEEKNETKDRKGNLSDDQPVIKKRIRRYSNDFNKVDVKVEKTKKISSPKKRSPTPKKNSSVKRSNSRRSKSPVKKSNTRRSRSPVRRSSPKRPQSPPKRSHSRRSKSPVKRSNSRRSRSPRKRSRSPRKRSRSPKKRSRSPRKLSRSPLKRSHSNKSPSKKSPSKKSPSIKSPAKSAEKKIVQAAET